MSDAELTSLALYTLVMTLETIVAGMIEADYQRLQASTICTLADLADCFGRPSPKAIAMANGDMDDLAVQCGGKLDLTRSERMLCIQLSAMRYHIVMAV